MEVLAVAATLALISWLFYSWGASIAERKGLERSLGWWSALLGFIGILVIVSMGEKEHGDKEALDAIERLAALRERGALTEEEFLQKKARLFQSIAKPSKPARPQKSRPPSKIAFCRECNFRVSLEETECPRCGRVFDPFIPETESS